MTDPTFPTDRRAPSSPAVRLPDDQPRASAWRRATTPQALQVTLRRVVAATLAVLVPLAFVPWQQSAPGAGRVIAYDPAERPQVVQAPVTGRVLAWKVREGQRVRAGEVLVELQDNDPGYLDRLLTERHLRVSRFEASQAKVEAAEAKREAALEARDAQLVAADAKVRAAEDKLRAEREVLAAADAGARTADVQAERARQLLDEGLRSRQSYEDFLLKADQATAKLEETRAKVAVAENEVAAARGEREKARTEADGKIAGTDADLQTALASARDDEAKILEIDTRLARQETQSVTAPIDGFVAAIYGGQGGEQVKVQDQLVLLVPDSSDRAVELWLDGNDVVLVRPGEEVRLQFEGWPALQFSGWPSVAIGTFGGTVTFVDATDDGSGRFRVFVQPREGETPWPDAQRLRQGVRAKGWVMLGTVPIAYELWRQLNDFPASLPTAPEKGDGEGGDKASGKAPGGPADPWREADKAGKSWRPK